MNDINGETLVTGIVGYPLRYSLSPIFQNHLFKKYKLNWVYVPFPIKPGNKITNVIQSLFLADIRGLNITIPYKETVLDIIDEMDSLAKFTGAVNTLKYNEGKLEGYNTDGPGFWDGYEIVSENIYYERIKLHILGSGGAAKGICGEGLKRGIKSFTIFARTPSKAELLKESLEKRGAAVTIFQWEELIKFSFPPNSVIINTTPLGMQGEHIPLSWNFAEKESSLVADIVYKPEKTPLLIQAEKKHIKILPGYYMLAGQGVRAFQIWTGKKVDLQYTAEFIRRLLNGKSGSGG